MKCSRCDKPKPRHDLYECHGNCRRLVGPCCLDRLNVSMCNECAAIDRFAQVSLDARRRSGRNEPLSKKKQVRHERR